MPVNEAETSFFSSLEAYKKSTNSIKPFNSIADFRASTQFFLQYAGNPAIVSHKDLKVPARDGFSIPIRLFNNQLPSGTPVLIFYPGGGYVLDLVETNSIACSRISLEASIKVALVNYRLAPENPLPQSIYDGYDATHYISAHADHFGIDANKIFIGGICSGANCAAAISGLAGKEGKLKIFHQILLNGSYDLTASNQDFKQYEQEDKILNRQFTHFIINEYFGIPPDEYQNPLVSPYYETDLIDYPPTTILVAEYDGLRSDSEVYYRKLAEAGIPVEKIVLPGQTHNTMLLRQEMSDGPDPAKVIADVINSKLNRTHSQINANMFDFSPEVFDIERN